MQHANSQSWAELFSRHIGHVKECAKAAMQAHGVSTLLVASGRAPMKFLDDMPYPFAANPQFKWWLPLTETPECWVVFRLDADKPTLLYHQPVDFWHEVTPLAEDSIWAPHFDIQVHADVSAIAEALPVSGKTVALTPPECASQLPSRVESNPAGLLAHLHYDRAVKTTYELACMRESNRLAVRGHLAARDAFLAGESELGIHLAYSAAAGLRDADYPYNSIVALNEHGAILHYQVTRSTKPAESRSFLIDAGAPYAGYAADITRTWAPAGSEFQAMIDAVDAMQLKLVDGVRAGVSYPDLHRQAHHGVAEILGQFGVLSGTPEAAVEQGVTRAFFPHGLGHLIGLQVHDVGGFQSDHAGTQAPAPSDHPYLRLTRKLEANQVVTVEPGLYFIDSLLADLKGEKGAELVNWERVDHWRPYGGIRIEDDVVVTADGAPVNLTREAFAEQQ